MLRLEQEAADFTAEEIPAIISKLSAIEKELESTTHWGVVIYDSSKLYNYLIFMRQTSVQLWR
jgi:hypothetical protein